MNKLRKLEDRVLESMKLTSLTQHDKGATFGGFNPEYEAAFTRTAFWLSLLTSLILSGTMIHLRCKKSRNNLLDFITEGSSAAMGFKLSFLAFVPVTSLCVISGRKCIEQRLFWNEKNKVIKRKLSFQVGMV